MLDKLRNLCYYRLVAKITQLSITFGNKIIAVFLANIKPLHLGDSRVVATIKEGGDRLYKKFEALLKVHGETAYQVSKRTGISTATLSEWKKGTYTPKIDKLQKIAEHFDVPVTYFLE